jgi:hypothetical protein
VTHEMTEEWRHVVGYEGAYEVSSLGRVRSVVRDVSGKSGSTRTLPSRIRAASANRDGYLQLGLSKDGVFRSHKVATLVALAFLGPRPLGTEIAHEDGDKTNNTPGNLSYKTKVENTNDKRRHGTLAQGSMIPQAKLNADQVREIRNDSRYGRVIASAYGVHPSTIYSIKAGKHWRSA